MPGVIRPRTCRECGKVFPGGPRAWYCPECRAERHRESDRLCKARKRKGMTRQWGSVDKCAVCGGDYVVVSGNQRYCPDCGPCVVKEKDAVQGMAYYLANAEMINPARNMERRKRRADAKRGK